MNNNAQNIFKKGSTTYFMSSLFFPPALRKKVTTLYAYVRVIDDFVDSIPQDTKQFETYCKLTEKAWQGEKTNNEIVDNFISLARQEKIEKEWVDSFLHAMRLDTSKHHYENFNELEEYMYGSADVIGYMMSQLMGLSLEARTYAGLQGKAMQLINFIRDIKEDTELGRIYMPLKDQQVFGVTTLSPHTDEEIKNFEKLINFEIDRYERIQQEAELGYKYIPRRYLIPIKTAAQMYRWTADQIRKNPLIVLQRKIKPSKLRIIWTVFINSITI